MPTRLLTAGTPLPYLYLLGLLGPNEILVATMFPSDPSVRPVAVPNLTQADYDLAVSKYLAGELKVLRFFASESASSDYRAYFADRGKSYPAIIDKPDIEDFYRRLTRPSDLYIAEKMRPLADPVIPELSADRITYLRLTQMSQYVQSGLLIRRIDGHIECSGLGRNISTVEPLNWAQLIPGIEFRKSFDQPGMTEFRLKEN